MPTIDRDGVEIWYEAHGSGPAVLLSHGYGATSRMWDGQVAAFADRYRIITWDMRGHGRSGDPDDPAAYSQALTVGDMAVVLNACGVERAVIGGLSLGGVMSLAFHLAHPGRVRALLLCDTGPGCRNADARAAWNERAVARANELEENGLRTLRGGGETRLGAHRSARGLAGAARGMLAQFDDSLIRSLPTILVPTLVLVGSEDKNFLAATDYMAAKIAGAQKGGDRGRRACRQSRPAQGVQPGGGRIPGWVARRLRRAIRSADEAGRARRYPRIKGASRPARR